MSLDDTLQIEQNVKRSGSSFYWGMKLLPKEKKEECLLFTPFVEKSMI